MTTLDTTLLEEITGSLAGCLQTLELAMAVTVDESAGRAMEACAQVIATSHEHLTRVNAMAFQSPAQERPAGPLTMGQDEGGDECQHLDLLGPFAGGALVCRDCAETIVVPDE